MKPAKYENPSSMQGRTLSLKCLFRPDDEIEDGHPDAQHAESIRNHIILYAREAYLSTLDGSSGFPPPTTASQPYEMAMIAPRNASAPPSSASGIQTGPVTYPP